MEKTREEMAKEVLMKAIEYTKAYNEGGHKKTELKSLKDAATAELNNYNSAVEKATYRKWKLEGDPVKTAVRVCMIEGAKRLNYKTDDDNYMTVKLVDADYYVNLPQMQATLGADVFHDPNWFYKCEKLIYLVANDINDRLIDDPTFSYKIDAASEKFNFPADVDPLTTEGAIIAMNQVFDAILFIDDGNGGNLVNSKMHTTRHGDIDSPEWRFIRESMTSESGKASVKICNTGKFSNLILRAMNVVLTNGDFVLEADDRYHMPKAEETSISQAPAKASNTKRRTRATKKNDA